jgi:hypothetical protein
LEKAQSFVYEKEILAHYGLAITTMDVRGFVHVKIFEGNKELTQWLKPSDFAGWVQGFAYAMRRQQTEASTKTDAK